MNGFRQVMQSNKFQGLCLNRFSSLKVLKAGCLVMLVFTSSLITCRLEFYLFGVGRFATGFLRQVCYWFCFELQFFVALLFCAGLQHIYFETGLPICFLKVGL